MSESKFVIRNDKDVRLMVFTGEHNTSIEIEELGGGHWTAITLLPEDRAKLLTFLDGGDSGTNLRTMSELQALYDRVVTAHVNLIRDLRKELEAAGTDGLGIPYPVDENALHDIINQAEAGEAGDSDELARNDIARLTCDRDQWEGNFEKLRKRYDNLIRDLRKELDAARTDGLGIPYPVD